MLAAIAGTATTGQGAVAGQISGQVRDARLVRAAHEFEAQLMKELLRPMTASGSLVGEDDGDSGGAGTLGEFASESLAGALSAGGGFGIANRILSEISRSGNSPINTRVIGNVPIDNEMGGHK